MKKLVGKKIVKLEVDMHMQEYLRFTTDTGEAICYTIKPDCCNDSWFNDVMGVEALLGHRVTSCDVVDWKGDDGYKYDPYHDYEDDYDEAEYFDTLKITLTTTRGRVDFMFRNSYEERSRHYTGRVTECDAIPRGTVLESITEDYSADLERRQK